MKPLVGALAVGVAVLISTSVFADRGVGVNLGSIEVEQRLKRGGSYDLPPLGVINTGDETSLYELTVSYTADQVEAHPDADWFDFRPRRFSLQPGETRSVQIHLTIPTSADPGDYFAHLQASTVSDTQGAGASIGVAAATKLSFTVQPSSWLDAQRVRINRWLDDLQPWLTVAAAALLAILLARLAARRYRVRIERR